MKTTTSNPCTVIPFTFILASLIATATNALEIQKVEPNNDFAEAQNVDDSFSVGAQYGVEGSEIYPWVSIRGTNDGTFDVYSFVVPAGAVDGIFDIDFTDNLDSWIDLYQQLPDGTFVLLLSNDDNVDPNADPGSLPGESELYFLDSRVVFMFTSLESGTYFIRVGRFCCPEPLDPGTSYTLNISLSSHSLADGQPPMITCPPNLAVQCAAGIPAPDFAGGAASDDRPGVTVSHIGDASTPGNCPNSFTIARTYRAMDASGKTADCTQIITVSDTTPPVLSGCPEPTTSFQCLGEVPPPVVVTAVDKCDGALLVQFSEAQSNPGSSRSNVITRTWTATDACGNTATCAQTIRVNDTTFPVVTAPPDLFAGTGPVPLAARSLEEFLAQRGTVADNCGATFTVTSSDSTAGIGPTVITRAYRIADDCGNTSTCRQTITVSGMFGADAIIWYPPFVRRGLRRDTDPSGGGTLSYSFERGRIIPIIIKVIGAGGVDVTRQPNITGKVELLKDTNCDGVADGTALSLKASGRMFKINGYLQYYLITGALPPTSQCFILRVTATDTNTGESRSETVALKVVRR